MRRPEFFFNLFCLPPPRSRFAPGCPCCHEQRRIDGKRERMDQLGTYEVSNRLGVAPVLLRPGLSPSFFHHHYSNTTAGRSPKMALKPKLDHGRSFTFFNLPQHARYHVDYPFASCLSRRPPRQGTLLSLSQLAPFCRFPVLCVCTTAQTAPPYKRQISFFKPAPHTHARGRGVCPFTKPRDFVCKIQRFSWRCLMATILHKQTSPLLKLLSGRAQAIP